MSSCFPTACRSSHGEQPELQLNLLIGVITHHSTETALLRVMNDLLLASDDGNGTLLTLFDLSAYFDTFDYGILFEKLQTRYVIVGGSLEWIKSYMTERSQLVRVSGVIFRHLGVRCPSRLCVLSIDIYSQL